MLTGTVTACRPAGAGWEADLRIGDTAITCRLPDRPPDLRHEVVVTVLDPPYFGSDGARYNAAVDSSWPGRES